MGIVAVDTAVVTADIAVVAAAAGVEVAAAERMLLRPAHTFELGPEGHTV